MQAIGVDISRQRSKSVDEFRETTFDLVMTVCDDAAENCPVWLGRGERVHMGITDPTQVRSNAKEIAQAFRDVRDQMQNHVLEYLKAWEKEKE
jgi:arsenate reductase